MTMKKYLDLFEAAPMPATSTALPATAKPIPGSTGAANPAAGKTVRPGSVSSYVGGPVDATAEVPDTSSAIPNTGSKMVNDPTKDFEESIEEMTTDELAEMRRLSGLPLNEKAVSKQQQKFMGMVHAMQKGEKVKGASPELKKAAKTMGKKDAKDFASTKHKGLPQKVSEGVNFVEMMRETEQTLEEMLTELHDEITEFKMTGHMGDKLRDAMELHRHSKNKLMGEANMVYEDDALNELAALAGLSEDGPGQFGMQRKFPPKPLEMKPTQPGVEPVAQFAADLGMPELPGKAFTDKERADYREIMKRKKAGVDEGSFDDFQTAVDKLTLPKSAHAAYDSWKARTAERNFQQSGKRYQDDAGTIYDRLGNPKDMPSLKAKDAFDPEPNRDRDLYRMQQQEMLRKIQKKQSGDLNECGDMSMDHNDSMNVSTNMSSDGTRNVTISAQGAKADELLSMLKLAGMNNADRKPILVVSDEEEMMEADRDQEYANTPEEEYANIETQFVGGDGEVAGMEKQMHRGGSARFSDNPLAVDEMLDEELDAMLESILLRDDTELPRNPKTGRVEVEFPPPKKQDPSVQELPLPPEPESRVSGPRTATIRFNDKGRDEEVDEMADLEEQGSGQQNPYPVGQDALTPQQKLNPTNNPNKSIVQGIKDFIFNPLKPGM